GGAAGGAEHPPALWVEGESAPGIGAAIVLVRLPAPGVMAGLPGEGDGVKDPAKSAGARVVGADVAGGGVVPFRDPRSHDEQVFEDDAGRGHLDGDLFR